MPIQTRQQDFEELTHMIRRFDELLGQGGLTPEMIHSYQHRLDTLDKKYANLTNDELRLLYEAQGLAELAQGRPTKGKEFLDESKNLSGGHEFVSQTARSMVPGGPSPTIHGGHPQSGHDHGKFSGKLEGWLVLYALRITLLPIYLMYDLISTRGALDGVDTTTSLGSSLNSYMTAATAGDIIVIAASVFVAVLFFGKRLQARKLAPFYEGLVAAYFLIFAIWLDSIITNNGISDPDNGVGKLGWGFIIAIAWLVYWLRSKRAQATFTNA